MNRLFYFIAIVFSFHSFGQNLIPDYQIGNLIDYNKKMINGYYDMEYAPKTALNISYKMNENFTKGYYFDTNGAKVEGLLKYSQSNRELLFKFNEKDEEKSIKADESNGYIIGIDTFSVVKNVIVYGLFGEKISNKSEFAENIESIGGMKFYKFSGIMTNGGASYATYIVKKTESSEFVSFPSSKSKFKSLATEIFGDDAILKDYIDNGKYIADDIPSILKIYKFRKMFYNNQNIYYNFSRDETNNEMESFYYSKIESVEDSIFHLSQYFKNKMKIYDGDFTSFYPHFKQNIFTFYYPNGTIRKYLSFKNNNPQTATEFYENGNKHRVYEILEHGTIIYKEVYNDANVSILNQKGTGNELYVDGLSGKSINYEYVNKRLVSAYYTAENGEMIYQLCENNAEIRKWNSLQKLVKENVKYPEESLQKDIHGFVLVKCIVEPSGLVSDLEIMKGLDSDINKLVLDFLSCFKTEIYWNPGRVDGKVVKQEIVLPIDFSIITTSVYRGNNYNNWYFNNMMLQQQQMMMMQQNSMIRAAAGFK
jgi:hypothetical protein